MVVLFKVYEVYPFLCALLLSHKVVGVSVLAYFLIVGDRKIEEIVVVLGVHVDIWTKVLLNLIHTLYAKLVSKVERPECENSCHNFIDS